MPPERPPIIGFCGASNSGKTTLVAKVIEILSSRGLKLGAIKHHGHPDPLEVFQESPDRPKDSTRLAQAGAQRVALSHSGGIFLTAGQSEAHLDPLRIAENYMSGLDLVIVEGYKRAPINKIEVVAPGKEPLLPEGGRILALAFRGGAAQKDYGLRLLDADHPRDIAQFMLSYYNL